MTRLRAWWDSLLTAAMWLLLVLTVGLLDGWQSAKDEWRAWQMSRRDERRRAHRTTHFT